MESVRSGDKTQLAAERKVHKSCISRYDKRKWLVYLPNSRLLDLDASHRRIDENLSRNKGKRRNGNITSRGPAIPPGAAIAPMAESISPVQGKEQPAQVPGNGAEKSADELRYWQAKAAREEEERKQAALKTRKDEAETQLAEMKAAQLAGTLVPAAGVERERQGNGRAVRNAVFSVIDRTATVLASMTSPSEIHRYLTNEHEKSLRGLCAELEQRAAETARTEESDLAVL